MYRIDVAHASIGPVFRPNARMDDALRQQIGWCIQQNNEYWMSFRKTQVPLFAFNCYGCVLLLNNIFNRSELHADVPSLPSILLARTRLCVCVKSYEVEMCAAINCAVSWLQFSQNFKMLEHFINIWHGSWYNVTEARTIHKYNASESALSSFTHWHTDHPHWLCLILRITFFPHTFTPECSSIAY